MPAVPVIARVALSAANELFLKKESEESSTTNLIVGITVGISVFILIFFAAIEFFMNPVDILINHFSSDIIEEMKGTVLVNFERPIIQTTQKGLLTLPVTNPTTSSPYGWRNVGIMGGLNFHEGLDFPVAFDTSVMAIAPGKVADCGVSRAYGDYIMLEHHMIRYDKDGNVIEEETFYSFYAHLYKRYVFSGQTVEQGREIAQSGGDPKRHFAGNSTGAHLHLELRRTPEYASHFDPYDYLLKPNPFSGKTKSIGWK